MLSNRHQGSTDNEDQLDSRRKAAKMLVAVVFMFGLCIFPVHLFNIFRYGSDIYAITLIFHQLLSKQ